VIEGSTLKVQGPEGELLDTVELEAGNTVSFHIEGDLIHADTPGYPAAITTHSSKNVGPNSFQEVLVEFRWQFNTF